MLIAVTMPSDCKSIHAISFSALSRKREHEVLRVKAQNGSKCSKTKARFQEIKIGQLNTKASRWNESHMQRGRLRNGQEEHQSTRGKWQNKQVTGDVRGMRFIAQSGEVADCGSKADPEKELNGVSFTPKCSCIPLVLLETSIWEHPPIRASTVEAGGFGASAARL